MRYRLLKSSVLGAPPDFSQPYTVIGAGIAGLLMGFHLKRAGAKVTILERAARVGGMLGSHHLKNGLAEQAANGFLWCPEMQALADALGLEILAPNDEHKARYLLRDRQLRKFPLRVFESLEMMGRMLFPHRPAPATLGAFGQAYGGWAFSRQLLAPAFAGIYGADIEQLSLPGAGGLIAQIMNHSSWLPLGIWRYRKATKSGSKMRPGTHSFKGGMGELVGKLFDYIKEDIVLNVKELEVDKMEGRIVFSTPAYVTSAFFKNELHQRLAAVTYLPLISLTLIVERAALRRFKPGFGCLIPRSEGLSILGVLFNHCIFEERVKEEDLVSLTCILRDDSEALTWINSPDWSLLELVCRDLDELFGLAAQPLESRIFRWPKALPLYSPALYESWFEIDKWLKKDHPHCNLFANYTGQIAIRGMCQAAAAYTAPT